MTRSIISTAAAMVVVVMTTIFAAVPAQAVWEGWGGLTVALDTDNGPSPEGYGPQGGFAPAALAEPDFAPAAIEEVFLTPTIGRSVHLCLSEECAAEINARRDASPGSGNKVTAGEVVSMTIVKVWSPHCVNGQALLDGNDSLWCTSVELNTGAEPSPGTWRWPERVA